MALDYVDIDRTQEQLEHAIDVADGVEKTDLEHAVDVTEKIDIDGDSVEIGDGANASATYSIALGKSSNTASDKSGAIAIGYHAESNYNNTIAIGEHAHCKNGDNAIAIGYGASGGGTNGIAIGYGASGGGTNGIAIGYGATATQNRIQLGYGTNNSDKLKVFDTTLLNSSYKVPFASLENAQKELVAGSNVTITDNQDGTATISATGGGGGGTSDYTDLSNKPSINSVTLTGNKSLADLGIQEELTEGQNITIVNGVISSGMETIIV